MRYKHYFGQTEICLHPMFSLVILVRGVGGGGDKLSRLVYLAPRPGFGSGSIISQFLLHHFLEYLVVRDINIISVKLRCLHPTFSLVTLARGMGGSCLGWFISPPPAQDLSQAVSSVNSYCTIFLEYLVVRDINIISVKLRCLHPTFSLVTLARGMGGSCLGWFISPPPPRPGFESGSVISQFLLHHNLGIFSCKRCEHYFSQTEMFTSNVQFGYPCLRGGWGGGGGKLSRLVYLAPRSGFESNSVIS